MKRPIILCLLVLMAGCSTVEGDEYILVDGDDDGNGQNGQGNEYADYTDWYCIMLESCDCLPLPESDFMGMLIMEEVWGRGLADYQDCYETVSDHFEDLASRCTFSQWEHDRLGDMLQRAGAQCPESWICESVISTGIGEGWIYYDCQP